MCNEPTDAMTSTSDALSDTQCMTAEEREAHLGVLCPSIEAEQLAAIAAYEESAAEPLTKADLALLAAVIRSHKRADTALCSLSSFHSTDEHSAAAMEHLIASMQDRSGHSSAPTLLDILTVGGEHTAWEYAPAAERILPLSELELGMLPLSGQRLVRHLSVEDTELHLAQTSPHQAFYSRPAADGCLVTLLSFTDDYARLHRLWSDERVRALLRCIVPVQHGTLAKALLSFSLGCVADVSVLAPDGDEVTFDTLDHAYGYLLVSDEAATRELLPLLRSQSFSAVTFARLTQDDDRLTLISRGTTLASLPMELLCTLGHATPIKLELSPRTRAADAGCNRGGRLSMAGHWERDVIELAGEPVVMGRAIVLHTTLPLHTDLAPADIRAALMHCALRLVAAGGNFDDMTASITLCVAENDATDTLWSAALGWRQAVLAWDLPTVEPVILPTAQEVGTLTVSLIAHAEHIPSGGTDDPVCLRLFAVETDAESGVARADEMRGMLSLTSRALRAGHIVGLRPLWDRPLGEALSAVKALSPAQGYEGITEDDRRVFGLLVRSGKALGEGVLLGTLPPADEDEDDTVVSDVCSLIHRPVPRVLLPVFSGMGVPDELLDAIRRMGAEPHSLSVSLTHEGCTALADAILSHDIVVLNMDEPCANAVLSHRRVAYALKSRLAEHASLFALHGAAAAVVESGLVAALTEANAPDLAIRLVSAPEGLERSQLARAVAYYR